MSRPKTVKSKSRSQTPPSRAKQPVKPAATPKVASSDSTPDDSSKVEHRADGHKEDPAEGNPWSEWQWCEEAQVCYRGRKDSKGEWDYEIAPLPKEKERIYTPPSIDPIDYLIEELKMIWEIEVPCPSPTAVTLATTDGPTKKAGNDVTKEEKPEPIVEEKESDQEEKKLIKGEETESSTVSSLKSEKDEKPKRQKRPLERRGRQLERKHFNQKDKKDKVDKWRTSVE